MSPVVLAEANLRSFHEEIERMGYGHCETARLLTRELTAAKVKADA